MAVIVALVLVACFASPYSSLPAAGGGIKVPPLSCRSRPPPRLVRPPGPRPHLSCHLLPRPRPRRPRCSRPRLHCTPLCRSRAVISSCSCKDRRERERKVGSEHCCHKKVANACTHLAPLPPYCVFRRRCGSLFYARETERKRQRETEKERFQ